MIASPESRYSTPEEYLEWEAQQPLRYEYVGSEVFAMTGGTVAHNTIALNLAAALRGHVRGGPCRVFMADVKVQAQAQGPFYYPDVMVSCDERDRSAVRLIQYPSLIVEVLSPSTEAYDRGGKFAQYRRISTLREYVLINAETAEVECFRLNAAGKWELNPYGEGEEVYLESLDFSCPIALIYEDVAFTPPA
ncbi:MULTISPECIES: Uma2 family endonuclease [Trichocoleus]|uniref:Uma2 family endonuclease n=1 Tax=Trichocoleus desertorum GB2-A4 TaxID=2933944 RepID=A0ABV0JE16_9CYAN|nr:Uma2 family endonuclease [Trichocoleus sp. FACHB-46]MBD1865185.1 Uma2 family endonuclease [Trichocoleus sp. FACHB-46]